MSYEAQARLSSELGSIKEQGLYKTERVITTPQSAQIARRTGARC
jgi:glycine C-acetyltransferase